MTFGRLKRKYVNTIVLAVPKRRGFINKRVKSWKVLQTISNIADCDKLISYYENNGHCDVVPISTHLHEEVDILPPRLVAKFWRVYLGM